MGGEHLSPHDAVTAQEPKPTTNEGEDKFMRVGFCLPEKDYNRWPESGYPAIKGASKTTLDDLIDPDFNIDFSSIFAGIALEDVGALHKAMRKLDALYGIDRTEISASPEFHKYIILNQRIATYMLKGTDADFRAYIEYLKSEGKL